MAEIWDLIVIGGGLAGSAVAAQAAQAGIRTLLIEKQPTSHHKVCGEFISIETQRDLTALGIDLDTLGAKTITTVRLSWHDTTVGHELPFKARSLSRYVLDEAVMQQATDAGAVINRGITVTSVESESDFWRVNTNNGTGFQARATMLATGKHELRGMQRANGKQDDLIGFKILLSLTPAAQEELGQAVELAFFKGGYAGLQQIESNQANLCLLVSKRQYAACGKNWEGLLQYLRSHSPRLRQLLAGAEFLWEKPLSIYGLPYGFIFQDTQPQKGLFRIGDQAAVIPSFSGDGMAIALHTARHAVAAFLRDESSVDFHRHMAQTFRRQMRLALWLSRLAVNPWGQRLIMAAARFNPALLARVAVLTRIDP